MTEKLGFNTQLEQDIFKRVPKIAKATVSLIMSVCLSVHLSIRMSAWKSSTPSGQIFMKFDICIFFLNVLRKFKFHSKSDKNDRYFIFDLE